MWVPICKKIEKKNSWAKNIYVNPFVKNLRRSLLNEEEMGIHLQRIWKKVPQQV
jgi:hypothetical protein